MDGCISTELPVFFELRVRYLLSCERVSEAMALAKCCAWHPIAGQHLFFLQVYLTWLLKTSQHDSLRKEVGGLFIPQTNGGNFHYRLLYPCCCLVTAQQCQTIMSLFLIGNLMLVFLFFSWLTSMVKMQFT